MAALPLGVSKGSVRNVFTEAPVVKVATDRKIMRNQPVPPRLTTIIVGLTAVLMAAAALGMFLL